MKKILILVVFACLSISNVATAKAYSELDEVKTFYDSSIEEMTSEYLTTFGEVWNATKVEEVVDVYNINDEKIGYLVIFDIGYLAYSYNFELYKVSHVGYPEFYQKGVNVIYDSGEFLGGIQTCGDWDANIFYSLTTYTTKDDFEVTHSITQIPLLVDEFDSSSWGDYQVISGAMGNDYDDGIIAVCNVLYTYKVNNVVDLTRSLKYDELRYELWPYCSYVWELPTVITSTNLINGSTEWLNSSTYSFKGTLDYETEAPQIVLYANNNSASTSWATKVATAKYPYWWAFYTYLDIVLLMNSNYYTTSTGAPAGQFMTDSTPFYMVDQKYRQGAYQLYKGSTLVTKY